MVVPPGTPKVQAGGKTYFYREGSYLVRSPRGFEVVPAPVGAIVSYVPRGAVETRIDGKKHYVHEGSYYRPYYQGTRVVYKVVTPPKKQAPPRKEDAHR